MIKRCFLLLLLLANVSAFGQRNVVLIIADDLGYDYCGFYADHADTAPMPNVRKLLKKGVLFSQHISHPYCSSTRAGMLTGRYGFRTGVGAVVGGTGGSGTLDTSETTIPKLLTLYNASIAKANIGKWHLHNTTPAANLMFPIALGYNHFEGPFIGALTSYTNWTKYTNGISTNVTTYATTEQTNNAISWVKGQNNKPFFLWLAYNAPHSPFHLPPSNLHSYASLPGTAGHIQQNPKLYFKAMIEAMDTEIGRLMDSLKALNKLDSTDFIFVGDNGNATQTAQINDVNKAKGTIYEYGVKTPLIISGPSVINPGRESNALVNSVDLFATILELFGYKNWQSQILNTKPTDSKSLLPILENKNTTVRNWAFCELFKTTTDSLDGKAIRNDSFKLISFDYGKLEFYNLKTDKEETNNLLSGNLSSNEQKHFNYLCTELTSLIGKSNKCAENSSVREVIEGSGQLLFIENPFHRYVKIPDTYKMDEFILMGIDQKIIYQGKKIYEQDFSAISSGIYFLKNLSNKNNFIKLIKE